VTAPSALELGLPSIACTEHVDMTEWARRDERTASDPRIAAGPDEHSASTHHRSTSRDISSRSDGVGHGFTDAAAMAEAVGFRRQADPLDFWRR